MKNIFEIIKEINRAGDHHPAGGAERLPVAARSPHRAYVLETGRVVLSGTGAELLGNDHVRKAFLGI